MTDSLIILNRLKKNLKNRKNLVKNSKLTAYRLYEKDIPEYPYIIDLFNQFALVYEKGKKIQQEDERDVQIRDIHQDEIVESLVELLKIRKENIIFKERIKQKGKNQYNKNNEKYIKDRSYWTVMENDMKFLVNFYDYLDPGLFLDHRPLRKIIKDTSKNKKVLNLFSYTGSISVAAALGGGMTTTIDMSNTYIDWAQDNFKENEIPLTSHKFIQADVLQYIAEPIKEKYDIIILDPPSFSNSKRMEEDFDVQSDHGKLIHALMPALKPDGILYFSNNFRKFKLDEDIFEKYQVKNITKKSIPMDFRDMKIHVCFEVRNK